MQRSDGRYSCLCEKLAAQCQINDRQRNDFVLTSALTEGPTIVSAVSKCLAHTTGADSSPPSKDSCGDTRMRRTSAKAGQQLASGFTRAPEVLQDFSLQPRRQHSHVHALCAFAQSELGVSSGQKQANDEPLMPPLLSARMRLASQSKAQSN